MAVSLVIEAALAASNSADGQVVIAHDGPLAPTILPQPYSIHKDPGVFTITASTVIVSSPADGDRDLTDAAAYLSAWLKSATGLNISVTVAGPTPPKGGAITLIRAKPAAPAGTFDNYELTVAPNGVVIRSDTAAGLFYAIQSLRQLFPPECESANPKRRLETVSLPCVTVQDGARFAWRGMLLDCCRHFSPKEFVKRYIDLLVYHKMNVFHWHLTDDQGWRIEIKKYPKLTEVGAWRKITRDSERDAQSAGLVGHAATSPNAPPGMYGGFYTQDDIREVVAYAAARHITVVPEIEMPGHSLAALASYPEFSCTGGPLEVGTQWGVYDDVYCAGNDRTFEFLQDVLSEVIELFPSPYVHVGGDECPKERWHVCPKCQARIKAEHLKDEHELQSYFIRRIETFLNGKGKRLIGWDEILEGGLAPNATVQSWRGMAGAIAAATAGHDVICSPNTHCYLDHAQGDGIEEPRFMGFCPLERTFQFNPLPANLTPDQQRHVLGVEGNMWTEHAPPGLVDRQVFPRLCAIAQVGWSSGEGAQDRELFRFNLPAHLERLGAMGVNYYIAAPRIITPEGRPVPADFIDAQEARMVPPADGGVIRYTLDGGDPGPQSPIYEKPLIVTGSTTIKARAYLSNGRPGVTAQAALRRMQFHEAANVPPGAVSGLRFDYYEGTWDRLPEFAKLKRVRSGLTTELDPKAPLTLGMGRSEGNYAVRFTGFVEVAGDGPYTFYLASDDGSRLLIGDEVVVANDGLHATFEKSGRVLLRAGKHPITIDFFQAGGAQALSVSYEGPNLAKTPLPMSAVSTTKP